MILHTHAVLSPYSWSYFDKNNIMPMIMQLLYTVTRFSRIASHEHE